MKIILRSALVLFILVVICHRTLAVAGPVQIVSVNNHNLSLEVDNLRRILERDELKNRYVSVVGIAGSSRKGKSFLLNFFLRYLYAMYEKHDVTNWIGENDNTGELIGFVWRGGTVRETTGILMWSEIFTYDYDDGRKVAIILIDTQGIFDGKSSVEEYSKIFALSMMFSSVQCYNVMQNIKEDDLQNLDTFTVYGQLARQQSDETPLQNLFFIVRDWRFAKDDDSYGLEAGQSVIDRMLEGNQGQTQDMHELRNRIKTSFSKVVAYLMPYPGRNVATGKAKKVEDMTPRFIRYLKELAPALFAPENLVIKQMNGRMIQTENLIDLIETSFKALSSGAVPSPKSILLIVSEMENRMLSSDCLQMYIDSMKKSINEGPPFFKSIDFLTLHQNNKRQALLKFTSKRKVGGDEIMLTFRGQLETKIENELFRFEKENDMKRDVQVERVNLHNEELKKSEQSTFDNRILGELTRESALSHSSLYRMFFDAKNQTLQNYTIHKQEIAGFTKDLTSDLEAYLNDHLSKLIDSLNEFNNAFESYSSSMQKTLDNSVEFMEDFANQHTEIKKTSKDKFSNKVLHNTYKSVLEGRLDSDIDERSKFYSGLNDAKRKSEIEQKAEEERKQNLRNKEREEENDRIKATNEAKSQNEQLYDQLLARYENAINNYKNAVVMRQAATISTVSQVGANVLREFDNNRRGEENVYGKVKNRLQRIINSFYSHLVRWDNSMRRINGT